MAQLERRCPSCNALAAPDAEWCGQCYASLREPPTDPATEPAADPAPPPTDPATGPATGGEPTGWPCPVCGGRSPIEADVCATCGTPFAASMRADHVRADVEPRDAVMWSLIFPGLGHRVAGRSVDGLARGVLFAMSAGMTVLLFIAGSGSSATIGVSLLFLITAVGTYVLSAVEAARLARGGDVLVGSRMLMWILVGMTFVAIGALALAVVGASRG